MPLNPFIAAAPAEGLAFRLSIGVRGSKTGCAIGVGRYACWMLAAFNLGGLDVFAVLSSEALRVGPRNGSEAGFLGWFVVAVALLGAALIGLFVSSPGRSDSDPNEGGGGPPRPPPTPPNPPPRDLPLGDANPARVRLRDDRRLSKRLPARGRRRAREPVPGPVPRSPTK